MIPGVLFVFVVASFSLFSVVSSFKIGPPVKEYPEICTSMLPIGHDAQPQSSLAPFEITTSVNCITENQPVFVTLSSKRNQTYFEGFFVQARPAFGGQNTTHGLFDINGDTQLQVLQCGNSPQPSSNNSLGHRQAKKYYTKTFSWTAPRSPIDGGVQFVATVVRETPEFWMDVKSQILATRCDGSLSCGGGVSLLIMATSLAMTTLFH